MTMTFLNQRIKGIGTTDSRQITNQRTCPYDPSKTFVKTEKSYKITVIFNSTFTLNS